MILTNTPQNEAVMSNVGQIGEFRIRNSAKAFSILSSGLYSNKIRAVIRELSCNAVDSHIAAGKKDTPFDVHFPTFLEPHFSIRDYGVGLDNDQVTNIYTTYFESTKTGSNEFIGALGLGSKSPFSYTDNFTVTAIKNGRRGIYTAFINNDGVPSIALMSENDTDESAGIEIQFSVNIKDDFHRFQEEARHVFQWFDTKPLTNVKIDIVKTEYLDRDIVPGIHHITALGYRGQSIAIMGNIAYPISVPNASTVLGDDLAVLLGCSLEIHFGIGELDFQASREGLSYIPQTIEAIKSKLVLLSGGLQKYLTAEVDKIQNMWERGILIQQKSKDNLWKEAARLYRASSTDPIYQVSGVGDGTLIQMELPVRLLNDAYNITARGFQVSSRGDRFHMMKPYSRHLKLADGTIDYSIEVPEWRVAIQPHTFFFLNDTKSKGCSRVKSHFKRDARWSVSNNDAIAYVLEPADRKKPAKFTELMVKLYGPNNVSFVSNTKPTVRAVKPPRKEATCTILSLTELFARKTIVRWDDGTPLSEFDEDCDHYYIPLNGKLALDREGNKFDIFELYKKLKNCNFRDLGKVVIHGVGKSNIKEIMKHPNWVNLEDYLTSMMKSVKKQELATLIEASLDHNELFMYTNDITAFLIKKDGAFGSISSKFKRGSQKYTGASHLEQLLTKYGATVNLAAIRDEVGQQFKEEARLAMEKYPMLKVIDKYRLGSHCREVASYINMIDQIDQKEGN